MTIQTFLPVHYGTISQYNTDKINIYRNKKIIIMDSDKKVQYCKTTDGLKYKYNATEI